MLKSLKLFIHGIIPPFLYVGAIGACLLSLLYKAEWGLMLLVAMIPQPNIWYKLQDYPGGYNFIDFLFFSVLIGMVVQRKGFASAGNSFVILFFVAVSYFALWNSSIRFDLPLPITTSNVLLPDWKNYAQMILLYFLVLNVFKTEAQQKLVVVLMSSVMLLMSVRSFRNFSAGDVFRYDRRAGGPFEAVGLGPNHFGAFVAVVGAVLLGLLLFDKDLRRRLLYGGTVLFGLHPLFFSYSRGAYVGAMGALGVFGVLKKRSLLALLVVLLFVWKAVLPASVVDRIMMTETAGGGLDPSAAHRVELWDHAMDLFEEHPVFGIGFGGFGFTVPAGELTDTHNFYMKTLSEEGVVGIVLLAFVFLRALLSGWRLYRRGASPFQQGLGFGFLGAVIACMITNLFGDRFSYFALGGYFWVFWGLVDRGFLLSREAVEPENAGERS